MSITAAMVKDLRESTGAGMMDAKKALVENGGDMDAAVDWLRTKGLAKAAKKSSRTAAEGLVAVRVDGGRGVAVEVNTETDFVSKNPEFQELVSQIADAAHGAADVEALGQAQIGGETVADAITGKVAKIGENMSLRRMSSIEGEAVVSYVHGAVADGMGKIGVLVAMKGGSAEFGKQVAMHVAASRPAALDEASLDPGLVEKEREIQAEIARESGKPENVIENMVKGRMKKFLAESTLMGQAFVVNPDLTVEAAAKENGAEITGFVRLEVGEGIEKEEEDFVSEVAKAASGG